MANSKICAGLVLYNPDIERLRENIQALLPQVDRIVAVDNKSANRQDIIRLAREYPLFLIFNEKNEGIAAALNQILDYSQHHGYDWFVTMDQDSVVSDNFIETAKSAMDDPFAAIICPFLLNNAKISMEEYRNLDLPAFESVTDPILCITSASLTRVQAAREIGGYANKLFIDCVDVDFNIRLMEKGWNIIRSNESYIQQQMGDGKKVPVFEALHRISNKKVFQKLSVTPVYSDFRLYHIARNSRYIYETYPQACGKQMKPAWMLAQFLYYSLTYPSKRSRLQMWKSIRKGWKDSRLLKEDDRV